MDCLETPTVYNWGGVFAPWETVLQDNLLIGMQGANFSIAVQTMDLTSRKITTHMSNIGLKYKALHMAFYADTIYIVAMKLVPSESGEKQ